MYHPSEDALLTFIPALRAMGMAMNYSIAVTNLKQYIFYMPSGKIDLGIKPGDPIPEGTAIQRTLQQGGTESLRGDPSTFGVAYLVKTFPLRDKRGALLGGCAVLQATETEDRLQTLSRDLAGAMDALTTASDGIARQVEEMRRRSDQLLENMEGTRRTIADSRSITDFVRMVSQQSDILSMNAVIEAARTGLRNSAFHVVAREMRSLAKDTKDSVEKINGILGQIRKDSEHNSDEVSEFHTLVVQISREMEDIFSTLHQVSQAAGSLQKISSNLMD